jgi:hypothetical protein
MYRLLLVLRPISPSHSVCQIIPRTNLQFYTVTFISIRFGLLESLFRPLLPWVLLDKHIFLLVDFSAYSPCYGGLFQYSHIQLNMFIVKTLQNAML